MLRVSNDSILNGKYEGWENDCLSQKSQVPKELAYNNNYYNLVKIFPFNYFLETGCQSYAPKMASFVKGKKEK